MIEVSARRNEAIEGLRGITIIMIAIYHIIYRFHELYLGEMNGGLYIMSMWGKIGVSIFLIISSYFLYNPHEQERFKLLSYYKKKLIRFWPLYFISITLTYIILHFFELPNRTCNFKTYIINIFWVNGFVGQPYVDGAHWYMTTLIGMILMCGVFKNLESLKVYSHILRGW